ncbi:MAG: hypothetical protein HQK96_09765 [Nitrospirae bacterium]|nr:hypothetical protein [Nitrospirota bacterium]MBF0554823.1 hypothetical protein [Nitrospirota bacterium]
MKKYTLTPQHPNWPTFIWELRKLLYCCKCVGNIAGTAIARRILETLENIDVEGTLELFRKLGGYTDCLIAYHVTELSFFEYEEREVEEYMAAEFA